VSLKEEQMSRALALLAVVIVAAAVFAGGGSSAERKAAGTKFAITQTVVPLFVKENGPHATRKVYWEGNPVFPVTVHEKGLCPESVNCGPRDAAGWGQVGTIVFKTNSNPLVSTNYYTCNGSLTSNYVIGIETWLTDSAGHSTAPVRNFWVCKTH
jgi:hypothetical protein